jgi:hypothetical protein
MLIWLMLAGACSIAGSRAHPAPCAQITSLDELVRRSQRIVVGKIARVHRVRVASTSCCSPGPAACDIEVAEIDVERTLWSADDASRVFLAMPRARGPEFTSTATRSIWFLAPSTPLRAADRAAQETTTDWASIERLVDDDCGRLEIVDETPHAVVSIPTARFNLPRDSEPPIPPEANIAARSRRASLRDVEVRIRLAIDADTPRITAELESFGPCKFRVRIEPDGTMFTTECGPEMSRGRSMIAAEWIIAACEREQFFSLPRVVGRDRTRAADGDGCTIPPPSDGKAGATRLVLHIRTVRGDKAVVIGAPPDRRRDKEADVDAYERALRIWSSIPIARGWKLPAR